MTRSATHTELRKKIVELEKKLLETGIGQLWAVYSESPIPTLIRDINSKKNVRYNPNGAKKFYRIILNKRQIGLQRIVGTNLQSPIGRVIKCKSDHRNTAGIRFLPKFS